MKAVAAGRKTEVDMTEGSIFSHILAFALPLLLGNIFQQLYNTVDTWVVGNYVGKVSFSAVGTVGPVVNTVIGFFSGFSSGAGVVISRYFGAREQEKMSRAVHTYVTVTLVMCLIFTAAGLGVVPFMVRVLKAPEEVAAEQSLYLTIYFAGVTGLLIYNMGSAILRAVGNSTYPFLFLVVCTVLNIILDLAFVIFLKMGTAGVAYATIISQAVSAVLVMILLFRTNSGVKVELKKLGVDGKLLKEIIRIGFPAAFQLSITAFSNVFVQSYINYFGTDVMGGWTAYSKIDQLFFLPQQSVALAITTFAGQNLGKGDIPRARRGVITAFLIALAATAMSMLPVMIHTPGLVRLFIDDNETDVIHWGVLFLRMNGPFFLIACVNNVYAGALRGAGRSELPMFHMLTCFVAFRQVYLFVVTRYILNTPVTVAMSYPLGWLLCSILMFVSYLKFFPKAPERLENNPQHFSKVPDKTEKAAAVGSAGSACSAGEKSK